MTGTPRPGGKKPPKAQRTLAGTKEIREKIMSSFNERLPQVTPAKRMSPQKAQELVNFVSCGGTISEFARRSGLGISAVHEYARTHCKEQIREARVAGGDIIAEEVLRIVMTPHVMEEVIETTDPKGGVTRTVKRSDAVFARKLAAWGCLEILKSWSPERYGNKVTVDAGGTFAQAIAAARDRVKECNRSLRKEAIDVDAIEVSTE